MNFYYAVSLEIQCTWIDLYFYYHVEETLMNIHVDFDIDLEPSLYG